MNQLTNALRRSPKAHLDQLEALNIRPISVGINSESIPQGEALWDKVNFQKCNSNLVNFQKERDFGRNLRKARLCKNVKRKVKSHMRSELNKETEVRFIRK